MSQGREAEAPADPCLLLEAVAWLVLAAPVGAFPGERLADGRTIAIGLAPTPADLDRAAAAAPAADTARSGLAANTNAQGYHVQPCSAHGRDTFTCPVIFAFPEGTVTVYFAVARELERRRERGRWAGPWARPADSAAHALSSSGTRSARAARLPGPDAHASGVDGAP